MNDVLEFFREKREHHIEQLQAFLSIPSVSTRAEHRSDVSKAARWTADQLREAGIAEVAIHETSGHPVITASSAPRPGAPTVLVYGHYDVQPAEPFELWTSPPFDPTVRGKKLFARGATDDKGQLFIHLKVAEAFARVRGALPVNLKFLIEGEEEIGSPNLLPFIKRHKRELACDVALVSDTHMHSLRQPTITTSLRGMTCLQVSVRTASRDLHSGTFGGTVANPIQVLAEMLVSCKDPRSGKVKISGFYEDVRKITAKQRRDLSAIPHDDARYARSIGAPQLFGERGYTTIERAGARPTFEVNGIWGGYIGDGMKTVLPCEAHAKVSMRLVADQRPARVAKLFREHLQAVAPPHAKVRVRKLDNDGDAWMGDPDFPAMRCAADAVEREFRKPPLFTMEGGSIPVVADFKRVLRRDTILLGFGLPGDNPHAPDESFDLRMLDKGLRTTARFLASYGAGKGSGGVSA